MKVAVTGAAGRIGRAVLQELKDAGGKRGEGWVGRRRCRAWAAWAWWVGWRTPARCMGWRAALVVGPDEYGARGRPRHDRDASGGMWGYVDSRDVARAARLAIEHLDELGPGNHAFNVGAADAHSAESLSEVIPRFVPELAD